MTDMKKSYKQQVYYTWLEESDTKPEPNPNMQNCLSLPSELCDMWQYQCQLFEFFPIGFLPGHVPAAKQSVGQLFGKGKEHLSDFMFISKVQQKNLVDQCNNIGLKIPINNLMDFYYPVFAKDPTLRVPRKEFNQLLLNFVMDFSQNKDLAYCLPVFFPSRLALFRQNISIFPKTITLWISDT